MPRYIDADALYEKLYPLDLVDKRLYTINAKAVADTIAKSPTADVIPKAKVEEMLQQIDTLIGEYLDGLYNTREFIDIFIELKKRYTEGELYGENRKS